MKRYLVPFILVGVFILSACDGMDGENGKDGPKVTTGNWTRVTDSAPWGERTLFGTVVLGDKIWVFGGVGENNVSYNDVWSSEDGVIWIKVKDNTDDDFMWSKRYSFTAVAFQNKIWVMGGIDNDTKNDVWNSSDGLTWNQLKPDTVDPDTAWNKRNYLASEVFQAEGDAAASIWVLGGFGGRQKNDVWKSRNGSEWSPLITSSIWPERHQHSVVVFDNRLWVLGGDKTEVNRNDVWSTEDGKAWTEETAVAAWSKRYGHGSVNYKGKIWVMGGFDFNAPVDGRLNDVWNSADGKTWAEVKTKDIWPEREYPGTVVFKDKVWIFGGSTYLKKYADVWYYSESVE